MKDLQSVSSNVEDFLIHSVITRSLSPLAYIILELNRDLNRVAPHNLFYTESKTHDYFRRFWLNKRVFLNWPPF